MFTVGAHPITHAVIPAAVAVRQFNTHKPAEPVGLAVVYGDMLA
jgi:hypothetical protein